MSDNPIFAVAARAAELRLQGAHVVTLAAGEPQAASSSAVIAAAIEACRDGAMHHYGAAQGDEQLRSVVAERLTEECGLPWGPADVQITLGAKHALFLSVLAITDLADEVLVARPGWPGHSEAVAAAGAVAVAVTTDDRFLVTVGGLERSRTDRTRAIILSSPGNPTGAVYSEERLRAIAAWAEMHDIWIISDDIYSAFDYTGGHRPILRVAPYMRARSIVVGGVSKEHAMTGWRVGWLAAPETVIAIARRHVSHTITHVPSVTQRAALAAIEDRATPAIAFRDYGQRRSRLVTALNEIDGIRCSYPDGGMFAFPNVDALLRRGRWNNSAELAAWLLETVHVAVVPGEAFGVPGHLRICFAVDDETLDVAIARVRSALNSETVSPDAFR